MKKRIKGKKLSSSRTARSAMYRSLARALVEHGQIKTTFAKAKGLEVFVSQLVTTARKDNLSSRRVLLANLANDRVTADKLYAMAKMFSKGSGVTRIVALPARKGDNAAQAIIQWAETVSVKKEDPKDTKAKAKPKTKDKKET